MEVLLIFKFFIFGHYWPFLAIFGHFWPFLGIFPSHDFGFLIFYYLSTNFTLMCLRINKKTLAIDLYAGAIEFQSLPKKFSYIFSESSFQNLMFDTKTNLLLFVDDKIWSFQGDCPYELVFFLLLIN